MTDKTLADLLDDIPDPAKDWLRNDFHGVYPASTPLGAILAAVKRHLPDPPYVPAVGDWVTIDSKDVMMISPEQPRLVAKVSEEVVQTVPIGPHANALVPWTRDLCTFRPAERPEVTP